MERAQLEVWLGDGLSLAEIGRRVGRDASTVGYWVDKYGLEAVNRTRHLPRGPLTREQLAPLVEAGLSVRQIAVRVDRGLSTVRHWLKQHRLETHRVTRRLSAEELRARGETDMQLRCRHHGMTTHRVYSDRAPKCLRCRALHVARRRRKVKAILVAEAGGRCLICGYNRSLRALKFHHVDRETKEFHLAFRGSTRSLEKARAEARKCVLLCANCHGEVESGEAEMPLHSRGRTDSQGEFRLAHPVRSGVAQSAERGAVNA